MFTGLVEATGEVVEVRDTAPGCRLVLRQVEIASGLDIGDSIAVNGCCLTVVAISGSSFEFDAGPETLARTNLGQLRPQSRVNLERSLKVGDRLGGHFVTGHIDTVATVDRREDSDEWSTFWFRLAPAWTRQMAAKGSVAVDGVSLTLVDVEAERFSVALIPHTLEVTTLGAMAVGDTVNIETDLLAKYVEKQLLANASQ